MNRLPYSSCSVIQVLEAQIDLKRCIYSVQTEDTLMLLA